MSDISKAYEPQAVEAKWYQFWLDKKLFVADAASKKPAYSIVIPPPNVTGVLHMGHVLNNTIQDILSRKARMDGKEVLWLPGTDHAGIATQTIVERTLKKQGLIKHRDDLGRDEFLKKVWEWKDKHGGIIIDQLKKLGCSCDWSRERFTMDAEYSRCVQKVFVELYKKGLIYRGKRMVNWCPASLTALSDEEVIMKEQRGSLYYFKVEIAEAPGTFLTIATTRPETIPGDTAVAVNPKDPRYAKFIGQHVIRPLPHELQREQKLIPIIGDEHVDFEFGTGVLKVTPAHDKADFEIGLRHKLAQIEVISANGHMNDAAGADLKGLERFKARKVAVEKLTELGSLEKEEPYTNNVGYSERADVPIEPRLSEQWFLKYPSVEKSRACVATAAMKFHPDRWAKVYDHWMGNIQDWCISRQLWWGHRIPVWVQRKREFPAERLDELLLNLWKWKEEGRIAIRSIQQTDFAEPGKSLDESRQHESVGIFDPVKDYKIVQFLEEFGYVQDPDVLDTWFSSWLWPFATMGWPEQTETLKKFYPTTDLVTGPDIIFFWVARMIMAGYEFMGAPKFGLPDAMPFRNVYYTGIIRDKQGRKMSKTLGNSPDPLDLIAKFGADALRFGVMRSAPLGQDVLFDEKDVELGRNFCNKLWNACRFRQMQAETVPNSEVQGEITPTLLTGDDKWILLKLNAAIRELTQSLADYRFSDAAQTLYRFFWGEYCDWYLETTKAVFQGTDTARKTNTLAVIDFILSHTLRLFHPFLPFITEELWHGLGYAEDMPAAQGGQSIMFAPWPKPFDGDFLGHYGLDDCYLEMAEKKFEVVSVGRNLRREFDLPSNKKVRFVLKPTAHVTPHDAAVLKILLNAEPLEINPTFAAPKGTATMHTALGELFLPLEGLVDAAAETARLKKELAKIEAEIVKVEQKLGNPEFEQKVPAEVFREHQQRLTDWLAKKQHVQAALKALEG